MTECLDQEDCIASPVKKRAVRRHHDQRKRAQALRVIRRLWKYSYCTEPELKVAARYWSDDMAKCSCAGCCNTRRNPWLTKRERKTKPEILHEVSYREWMMYEQHEESSILAK